MKKIAMLIMTLAATALFTQPTFADDTHQHEKGAQAAQEKIDMPSEKMSDHEGMMQESMKKMHDQMEAIKQAKEPSERLKLLQEHSESMRDSIGMMREMMGGMTMGGGMGLGHKMHNHPASQPGSNAATVPPKPEEMATSGKASDKPAKQLWVCPMHPEVVQDHPGVCPICGMDLVEMEQSDTSKSGHNHKMEGCMMGGGSMKGGCMKGGCMKGGGMKGGCMKGGCMKGGGMKDSCMKGKGMKSGMKGMVEEHMDMMLMLMEQMIEHNDAEMAVQK